MARASHPIDTLLADLRQDMGNTLCMIDIVITLGRNQRQFLPHLRDMLGELSQHIEAFLPAIPEKDDDA
jgi:hypothetical protein